VTGRWDQAIRDVFERVAAAPVPSDLAEAAIRRAARDRRRRATLAAASAVVAVAVAVPIFTFARSGGDTAEGPAITTGTAPSGTVPGSRWVITAYSGVTSAADSYSLVLDRQSGAYERLPYQEVVPSPDGSRLIVTQSEPGRTGVMDRATGAVRWIPGVDRYVRGPTWSPDGASILLTTIPKDDDWGFAIVDADDLTIQRVTVAASNTAGSDYFWAPDGRIGLQSSRNGPSEADPEVSLGVVYFDLSGREVGALDLGGGWIDGAAAFSPDGRRVAVSTSRHGGEIVILDIAAGTQRQRLRPDRSSRLLGWYDDAHLMLRGPGPELSVVDLAGVTVRTVRLHEPGAQRLCLAPATGLGQQAAAAAF
jgi:hypothetical protein